MEVSVTSFFGHTITVGAVVAAVTQFLKLAEDAPVFLKKVPYIGSSLAWMIDTITPEDPAAIRIFVVGLCFGLNSLGAYMANGYVQMDVFLFLATLKSFVDATAGYVFLLKPWEKKVTQ